MAERSNGHSLPPLFKYKPAYGLKLNICTNDPEICGFMTNEIKAGNMQIIKCDECQDGYLIVKPGKDGYFLGCTNYKEDGTGCNNSISRDKYNEMMNLTPDIPKAVANTKYFSHKTNSGTSLSFNSEKSSIYFLNAFHCSFSSTPFCENTLIL